MKSLKITFLLLAVLFMTMSGTSSDNLVSEDSKTEINNYQTYDLLVHNKAKRKVPTQG